MKTGDTVYVQVFGGEWVQRKVVAAEGGLVFVCTADRYEEAVSRGKEPQAAGFKSRWVRTEEQYGAEHAASQA